MKTCWENYWPYCGGKDKSDNDPASARPSSPAEGTDAPSSNTGNTTRNGCNERLRCFRSWLRTLYPAFCWVVILLIDGKYAACGLYSKCNSTMSTVDMKDPEIVHIMTLSKISGFSAIAAFVLFYFIYLCCDCFCRSPADRYEEMYRSKLKKEREKFARNYAKTCSKNRATRCEKEVGIPVEQSGTKGPTPSGARAPTPPGTGAPTPSGAGAPTSPGTGGAAQSEKGAKEIVDIINKGFDFSIKNEHEKTKATEDTRPSLNDDAESSLLEQIPLEMRTS
ncbi:hypothetical protein SKAU_G00406240 [Synaphobranchus kaupii]|uniref:Uncharacterized protein n=1 Tax=Synaphobranchus kaupii TaxID=118154 RepID=A0A9Q1EA53_SYNKA|nr:hypothetical protein SKAU_G00406240 [Synaphobranchus kaupii]